MAVIPPAQIQPLYSQGGTDLVVALAVRDVQAGDTVDLSTVDLSPAFTFVRFAVIFSFSAGKAGVAQSAGTVITIPAGLPANSSLYLFVGGC